MHELNGHVNRKHECARGRKQSQPAGSWTIHLKPRFTWPQFHSTAEPKRRSRCRKLKFLRAKYFPKTALCLWIWQSLPQTVARYAWNNQQGAAEAAAAVVVVVAQFLSPFADDFMFWFIFNEAEWTQWKPRTRLRYQAGNIYDLCPQAPSVVQLIAKSESINDMADVEMITVWMDWTEAAHSLVPSCGLHGWKWHNRDTKGWARVQAKNSWRGGKPSKWKQGGGSPDQPGPQLPLWPNWELLCCEVERWRQSITERLLF